MKRRAIYADALDTLDALRAMSARPYLLDEAGGVWVQERGRGVAVVRQREGQLCDALR